MRFPIRLPGAHEGTLLAAVALATAAMVATACGDGSPPVSEAPYAPPAIEGGEAQTARPAQATAPARATDVPRIVTFTQPAEGETHVSPVEVCLAVEGVALAPAGEPLPGGGHIIVMVDPTSQESGRLAASGAPAIPPGPRYIHVADGSECTTLELSPGPHALVGLVADGLHVPLNPQVAARVSFTVAEE